MYTDNNQVEEEKNFLSLDAQGLGFGPSEDTGVCTLHPSQCWGLVMTGVMMVRVRHSAVDRQSRPKQWAAAGRPPLRGSELGAGSRRLSHRAGWISSFVPRVAPASWIPGSGHGRRTLRRCGTPRVWPLSALAPSLCLGLRSKPVDRPDASHLG